MLYHPPVRISYRAADEIQQRLVRQMLDFKAGQGVERPQPTLLAFEMDPVYTCGRRQVGKMSPQEVEYFKSGELNGQTASFFETQRGGHVTFHGPGQLVMYPILDLRAMNLKIRDYMCRLEGSIIELLEDKYGIPAKRTENTGVWVDDTHKIASLGIHVRRSVTSHGLGLNISTDPYWFNRVVACNLPQAQMVSMDQYTKVPPLGVVSRQLAEIFAKRMGLELETVEPGQKGTETRLDIG